MTKYKVRMKNGQVYIVTTKDYKKGRVNKKRVA